MLEKVFIHLLKQYTADDKLINKLWNEISTAYSKRNRHYHTLQHLENLLTQLTDVKSEISNWSAVLFALFYHDIVYDTLKHNNEEKSAVLAITRMREIYVDDNTINKCEAIILATKAHQLSGDNDINLFTDADLSILGASWNDYEVYLNQVRKEYALYPDIMYNPGRKKVLQHFLRMERIYKTEYYHRKLEFYAKQNIQKEIDLLK